jgi:ATPase subunit of ABC transporter with duplicated ATPase domains
MENLDGERTVLEELQAHAPLTNQGTLRNLAGAFGFHDEDVAKPIRVLSGGERRAWRWQRSSSTRRTCSFSTSRPTTSTS